MSILTKFFQNRHNKSGNKEQVTKNEAIASIFSTPFELPKTKIIAKNKILKKQQKLVLQAQDIPQNQDEGENLNNSLKIKTKKQNKKKLVKSQKVQDQNKKQNTNQQKKPKNSNSASKQKKIDQNQNTSNGNHSRNPVPQVKNEQPQNLDSTIFVGNVSLQSTHKTIKKYFEKYGKVLKVWFRSIPVEQSKIPKKGLHILKKYQQGADSMNAYVKFQQESQAKAACAANGSDIQGKNIKVTLCKQYDLDYQTTIFIGNLPRKINDQQLWDKFKTVGKVNSVRVIRNKDTHQGIGIGYVRFETTQQMKKAIKQMNGKEIGDRPMRIKKAVAKERLEKKVRKIKQKKQLKFKKSHGNQQKTGKGINSQQNNNNQQDEKKSNYPYKTNKKISKPQKFKPNENPKFNNNKRQLPTPQNKPIQQSSQIIRSKFGFHGTKKILQ